MEQVGPVISNYGLENHGLKNICKANWNLCEEALIEQAIIRGEGKFAKGGALLVETGIFTGRSPQDRFIVEDDVSRDTVDWGNINKPISPESFDRLYEKALAYTQGREVFVVDAWGGTDESYRLPVRFINMRAYHNLFIRNMFLMPTKSELENFTPEFTVLQCPELNCDPELDTTRTDVFIVVNFTKRMIIIGGTEYSGEMKKGIFGVLNYMLPEKGIMPMHCSANIGPDGRSAIFFGLSGTGKTTLSADSTRTLIGDDEHGWGSDGIFNFEGGCYAKVIGLDPKAEPEIYATTHTFGTILENVIIDDNDRRLDLDDSSKTENTRSSYPITQVPNATLTGKGPHPANVIMLTCDAFGVLPPISKMTTEQAMYHFLSGYTAKVAGTERGVTEPSATFSTCFGAPFMPRRPAEYAKLLGKLIEQHGSTCWLVNTGWSGGGYGTGSRMKIAWTRALVHAALNGELDKGEFVQEPNFGLYIPTACSGVPAEVLSPKNTWQDKDAYEQTAHKLAGLFEDNFKKYEATVSDAIKAISIRRK